MTKEKTNKEEQVEKSAVAKEEEKMLAFWQDEKIFEKSLEKEAPNGRFTFFDGPPFATGLPHYGHILAGTVKDVFPRYQTMRGKRVERRWGWDCHGLPLENLIEKELGLKTKQDIEDIGIDKFNEAATQAVMRYADEWKKIIPRTGRFVDMENDYRTMDWEFSESTWWIFKTLFEKGLIYEGYKPMHICPRCETTLSNFEVNQGYADIKDLSVVVKFALVDEPETYLLAWTTTPWTLPGNMALAVNPEEDYVELEFEDKKYILAKSLVEKHFAERDFDIKKQMKGTDLVGKKYEPVFSYYQEDFADNDKVWRVYAGDFVTMEDGTGVVHIAPAFGADDSELAMREDIPVVHHVGMNGRFKREVTDWAGEQVKPKDDKDEQVDHTQADVEIIKWLAHNGKLFAKEKIEHSYPHCWRCDTPLLNYATSSWFIKVTDLKDRLLAVNKKIGWVPDNIGTGRFGKWLEGARDWAISRSRYWGAPLPVWRNDETGEIVVVGGIEDLRQRLPQRFTKLVFVRHGESTKNTKHIWSDVDFGYDLTATGEEQADAAGIHIANQNEQVDAIYTSPIARTKETAEHLAKKLGVKNVMVEERIREIDSGNWDEHSYNDPALQAEVEAYYALSPADAHTAKRGGQTGESRADVEKRVEDFLQDIIKNHPGETVVIVSHMSPLVMMMKVLRSLSPTDALALFHKERYGSYAHPFSVYIDTETGKAFDFHRPYIDDVVLPGEKGGELRRIPEVFDCWYESGSMPYGQHHYPFESFYDFDPEKGVGFPADFISEGLDQTRGWFYSLLVLGVGLFDQSPFENVIVHGLVMAEDGKKMSKRLKNYPDPAYIMNTYGADAMRMYMLNSPLMHAEDLNFTEKGVAEVMRKIVMRLENVYAFYDMYGDDSAKATLAEVGTCQDNALDKWMLARLQAVSAEVTAELDAYHLDKAARPIFGLLDDLSTWYLRRSRDRFKSSDEVEVKQVTSAMQFILLEIVKLMAPFTPFIAESIYQKLKKSIKADLPASVHLSDWSFLGEADVDILAKMERVREIVSLGFEARDQEGIKVRQPLATLYYGGEKLSSDMERIIADEMNVKEIKNDTTGDDGVRLDTALTAELLAEGDARELVRAIQGKRKKLGLTPAEEVEVGLVASEWPDFVEKHRDYIVSSIGASGFDLVAEADDVVEVKVSQGTIKVVVKP